MESRLEHFHFKWEIVNLSMWNMETALSSPRFEVRSRSIYAWKIELWPQKRRGQEALSVRLRMYSSNSEAVLVNYKISAINQCKRFWLVEKGTHLFQNEGVWISSSTPIFEEVRGNIQDNTPLEKETWVIECELLYADSYRYGQLLHISRDWQTVKELSDDLLNCFRIGAYKDVQLNAGGRIFAAHRAILWARHPSFRPKLGDPNWLEKTKAVDQQQLGTISLDLEEADGEFLRAALKFAYIGDLEVRTTGTPPPIGLYEYAEKHGLRSLKRSLELRRSTGQTDFKASTTQLFFCQEKCYVLTTDEFTFQVFKVIGSEEFRWQLSGKWIIQKSEPNRRSLSFYLKPLDTNKVLKVKLILSIISSDRTYSHTRCVIDIIPVGNCLEVGSVIYEDILINELINLMPDNVLTVYCHITCSTGKCKTYLKTRNTHIYDKQLENNLISLCNDMRELLRGGFFADAFVVTKEEVHKVHRFLLSVRSAYFATQFRQKLSRNKNSCPVIKVDNINEKTLLFMYCGRINLNHNLAIELHADSESFGIPSLKKFCREFFKSAMCRRNVCDILKSAERNGDYDLKMAAMYYAKNFLFAADLPGFDDLQKEFPHLAEELEYQYCCE